MRQIVKTEIIYYKTPKDFEFEFNLCGACQMRLLTETCEQKKEFLLSLSKAVSRCKIVLICTEIDSEFTDIISSSIGYTKSSINADDFGIKSSPVKELPKDAVPLVTSGGLLGGFVLECGPQSLIILSADRDTRNELMTLFVNEYIKDISNYEPDFAVNEEVSEPEQVLTEEPENKAEETPAEAEPEAPTEEPEASTEEPVEPTEKTENDNTSYADNDDAQDEDNDVASIYIPSELIEAEEETNETTAKLNFSDLPVYVVDENSSDTFSTDSEDYYNDAGRPKPLNPFNILILIVALIVCALLIFLGYEFIISPLLDGVSIADNFNNFWSSVF